MPPFLRSTLLWSGRPVVSRPVPARLEDPDADARVAAAGQRLAAAVLAVHDRDRQRLRQLVEDVPAGLMLMVIESLAAITDEGVMMAMRNPGAAREALAGVPP